jgi:hypothetical protein
MLNTLSFFGRAIVARCPKTKRLHWFPQRMTETSGGVRVTWTHCPACWHGGEDLHSTWKAETGASTPAR